MLAVITTPSDISVNVPMELFAIMMAMVLNNLELTQYKNHRSPHR